MRGNHDGDEDELWREITVLSEERIDRIMDGLDVLASRGLLDTDEAADLTARIQRLTPDGAEPDRVPAPAE